jgi:uncharacterized membrane protein YbhN (UPF0104 family)
MPSKKEVKLMRKLIKRKLKEKILDFSVGMFCLLVGAIALAILGAILFLVGLLIKNFFDTLFTIGIIVAIIFGVCSIGKEARGGKA